MTQRVFDPIIAARDIESSYREYLEATIHFDDADLQSQLEGLLAKPGYLSKGPFLESAAPYKKGATPSSPVPAAARPSASCSPSSTTSFPSSRARGRRPASARSSSIP